MATEIDKLGDIVAKTHGFTSPGGVPVLRLNSVALDDLVTDPRTDNAEVFDRNRSGSCSSASEFYPSSYYNTSDAEGTDSGLHTTGSKYSRKESGDDDEIPDEEKRAKIIQKLVAQVELMFSDDHLASDGFLLKHIRRRNDGYVSLKLIAGLRKVKQISRDFPTVLEAVRFSLLLDVNLEGTKVRRIEPLTPFLLSLPQKGGTKDPTKGVDPSVELTHDELLNRLDMKTQSCGNQKKKFIDYTNSGGTSPVSSNASSRHGSFSKRNHTPADMFHRNVRALITSEDSPPNNRRRGGSLPIPVDGNGKVNFGRKEHSPHLRRKHMFLTPDPSPPSGGDGFQQRPKSNSYSEGIASKNDGAGGGMSTWLQERRRASSARSSEGLIYLNDVTRQPRGPDGTKGFASGSLLFNAVPNHTLSSVSA